jgi:hypothetical protein
MENVYSTDNMRWKRVWLENQQGRRQSLQALRKSLDPTRQVSEQYIELNYDRFIPNHFQLIVHLPSDRRCIFLLALSLN